MMAGGEPQHLGAVVVAMALFGAVVGVTVKKVARLLALVVVVQLAVYRYLESKGLVRMQLGGTGERVGRSGFGGLGEIQLASLVSTGTLGLSFAVGFAVGITRA
jgi:uncharacterized membrane protein (Fun14 family)